VSPLPVDDRPTGTRALAHLRRLVGNTPYLSIRLHTSAHLCVHLKLEGQNPTGSVKDRAALTMLEHAVTPDVVSVGRTILDASSGNMACSLAYFGACTGLPVTVVVSSKLTREKRAFLDHVGATVITIGNYTIEGNLHCREQVARPDGDRYVFIDQLHNWNNPRAHEESTGPEILRDVPHCRMLVGSLGSGGTLLGTARYLKAHIPDLLVVAAEAASGTRMPGVGAFVDGDYITPFIRSGIDDGVFDVRVQVALVDAAKQLLDARTQGVFGGPQTGAVLHAAQVVARERDIAGDVVVISGDSGWKNLESLTSIREAAAL
jgi:cysteine synthase